MSEIWNDPVEQNRVQARWGDRVFAPLEFVVPLPVRDRPIRPHRSGGGATTTVTINLNDCASWSVEDLRRWTEQLGEPYVGHFR